MAKLTRDDLFHVYFWSSRSMYRMKRKTAPSEDDFVVMDGHQMLFLLNWIGEHMDADRELLLDIERFIRTEALGTTLSEKEIIRRVDKEFFQE